MNKFVIALKEIERSLEKFKIANERRVFSSIFLNIHETVHI